MKKTLKYYLDLQKKLFAAGGPYGNNINYDELASQQGYTPEVQNADTSKPSSGFGNMAAGIGLDLVPSAVNSKFGQNAINKMTGFNADDVNGDFGYKNINELKQGFNSAATSGGISGAAKGAKITALLGGADFGLATVAGAAIGSIAPYIGMKKKLQEAEEGNQRANGMARQRFGSDFGLEEKGIYAFGGDMTQFTGGGTHEQNPNNGIDMGNGLAEEGETKHDNFIYSDRLKVNEYLADMFSLPSRTIGKSFADASKLLSKESEERPNDAVSLRSRESMLNRLKEAHMLVLKNMEQQKVGNQMEQGAYEQPEMESQEQQMFAYGGQDDEENPCMWACRIESEWNRVDFWMPLPEKPNEGEL